MGQISSRTLLAAALLLGLIGIGQPTWAQDEADPEEEQPAQQARARAVFMTDEQFDQWVFGRFGGAERAARQFESQLFKKIRDLDQMYGLTPEQKKKLEVAGKRDIQRFFNSVLEKKEMLDRAEPNNLEFHAFVRELQEFRRNVPGEFPFGEGSLLAKTLKKNLVAEQYSRYNREFYRARVESVVSSLHERLGLSREQHRRFVALIVEETPPLKRYGAYDLYAVIVQASKLPEDKLKPIFDEAELRDLREKFSEARVFESIIRAKGYLDGEWPEMGHSDTTGEEKPKAADVQAQPVRQSPLRRRYVEE